MRILEYCSPREAAWVKGAVLLALLGVGCVAEQPAGALYKVAQREEAAGHYEEAVYWYRRAARGGSAKAQERLADVLSRGQFGSDGDGHVVGYVGPAPAEAARWRRAAVDAYKKAARRGDAEAQVELADLYLNGRGVEQDTGRAAYWLRRAANQGDETARRKLRFLKEYGVLSGEP